MTISGKITYASTETGGTSKTGRPWRKREYIVEYHSGQYPKSVLFQVMNDNIDKLNIQQGQEYDLAIDFETREWNGRRFMQASCFGATPKIQPAQQSASQPVAQAPNPSQIPEETDDLPF